MKKYCFFTFCFFLSIILYGQSKLQDYTLDFPGTSLKLEMIAIPAGTFVMGGNTQSPEEEKPPHKVQLDEFWMAKYETTWDLYNLYLERSIEDQEFQKSDIIKVDIDAVSGATIPYVDMSLGMGKGKDLPVGNVTYLAASQFCKWLSAKTGDFYRLPTEAEWEYAARAGSNSSYFFGEDPMALANFALYAANSDASYHKVGEKQPNSWGLYDVYGNVAEWTLDAYDPKYYKSTYKISKNPFNVPTSVYPNSVRGGSYKDDAFKLRSSARFFSSKEWKRRDPQFPKSKWWNTDAPFVGFRIVRDPNPPSAQELKKYWGE